MARPSKWATVTLNEPFDIGKAGIDVVIRDKHGRKHRGTLRVSVGGIRWWPYNAKRPSQASWDALERFMEGA